MGRVDRWDALAVLSLALVDYGLWRIYPPLAFIAPGVIGLFLYWLHERDKRGDEA